MSCRGLVGDAPRYVKVRAGLVLGRVEMNQRAYDQFGPPVGPMIFIYIYIYIYRYLFC